MNIKLNDQIKVNGGLGDELTFKVIKVSDNSITIETSKILLNRLVTDMGVSYTIKLER